MTLAAGRARREPHSSEIRNADALRMVIRENYGMSIASSVAVVANSSRLIRYRLN